MKSSWKKTPESILDLKGYLEEKSIQFNRPEFIVNDPVSIPHLFKKKEDIEIAGLFAAVLAWGQRPTIIRKAKELMQLMDMAPHEFLLHLQRNDLRRFDRFVHRTFNGADTRYFVERLKTFYRSGVSLEDLFQVSPGDANVEPGLIRFHDAFFSAHEPGHARKHISSPARKSACKRLNMYLRWMVRRDKNGVDFGLWKKILPAQLVCPCDVHVERVARKLNLINSHTLNWQAAVELTANLKKFDSDDPVKYDFALFGIGVEGKF